MVENNDSHGWFTKRKVLSTKKVTAEKPQGAPQGYFGQDYKEIKYYFIFGEHLFFQYYTLIQNISSIYENILYNLFLLLYNTYGY